MALSTDSFIKSNEVIFVFNLTRKDTFLNDCDLFYNLQYRCYEKHLFLFGTACECNKREVEQKEIDNFIK